MQFFSPHNYLTFFDPLFGYRIHLDLFEINSKPSSSLFEVISRQGVHTLVFDKKQLFLCSLWFLFLETFMWCSLYLYFKQLVFYIPVTRKINTCLYKSCDPVNTCLEITNWVGKVDFVMLVSNWLMKYWCIWLSNSTNIWGLWTLSLDLKHVGNMLSSWMIMDIMNLRLSGQQKNSWYMTGKHKYCIFKGSTHTIFSK